MRIKFDTGCLRIATVNRTCGRSYDRFFLLAGQFLVRRHQTASPGGSWPGAAGTDEGRGSLADRFAVSAIPSPLPCPHPPLRGTFPQRKALGFLQLFGFPYEGKLSAARLTDEVDSAA